MEDESCPWSTPQKKASEPLESIEINGVRFMASEVHSVTLKRGGREISIAAPEEKVRSIGFGA